MTMHGRMSCGSSSTACFTFGLDLLTVRRDDDTLDLAELHVLGDFPQAHDQPALGLGLGGVLLVHALLEAHQLLQQQCHALVDLLVQHLVAVPGARPQGVSTVQRLTNHSLRGIKRLKI